MTTIIAYVPVVHEGYVRFFASHPGARMYILGPELVSELGEGHREIRAVEPEVMAKLLTGSGWFESVQVLNRTTALSLKATPDDFVLPDDEISHRLRLKYLGNSATFDTIFLRWDTANVSVSQVVNYDHQSSKLEHVRFMQNAQELAEESADWWRQVGGLIVKDGQVTLSACNHHVPTQQTAYTEGDPRDFIPAGAKSELNTTLHAEQHLITAAARHGISLEGTDLYVTVFPCPMCAKQVAYSGIARLFFASGHTSLDGEAVLKSQGVKIILVK